MSFYQGITPLQEPFDLGKDDKDRQQVAFNIRVVKTASNTFLEELVKILVTAGVGVFNTNIFASTAVAIPKGEEPYLMIIETGGAAPLKIQNQDAPAYPRPTAKIIVHAAKYSDARTMSRAAYDALAVVKNQAITP